MGALVNPHHELFVREWVELELDCDPKARAKAYERAGYAPGVENARRLSNTIDVKARFRELFGQALEYRDVRIAAVVNRIDRIGRANLVDFFERGPEGKLQLKDITTLPRELTDALAAIEWDEDGNPKLKLWDKNQANFTLLKHMGGIAPEQTGATNVVNVGAFFAGLSVDDQRALAEALEAIPNGPEPVGSEAAGEHRPE
jgi:Terminase small subunit